VHAIYSDKRTGSGQIYYLQNPTGNPSPTAVSITLTSSNNPAEATEAVPLHIQVVNSINAQPVTEGGTITIKDGTTIIVSKTLPSSGTFTWSTALPIGTHNLEAVYGGSADFKSGSKALSQTVTAIKPIFIHYSSLSAGTLAGSTLTLTLPPSSSLIVNANFSNTSDYAFGPSLALHQAISTIGQSNIVIQFPSNFFPSSSLSKSVFIYTRNWGVGSYGFNLEPRIRSHGPGVQVSVASDGSSWVLTVAATSTEPFTGILSVVLGAATELEITKQTTSRMGFTLAVSGGSN